MSNIIKSFRIIESEIVSNEDEDLKADNIHKELLVEARQKHDEMISQANKEAKKIIDSAHDEYDERLNLAYEKAKEISKEYKQQGYDEGYELGQEEGHKEGYEKGYEEGKEESKKLIDEALQIKDEYICKKNQLLRETEEDLIKLIITIYEKVLYKKVEEDEELIISLVLNGIDNLEIKDKLTVIVSEDDYEIINESKNVIFAKASLIDEIDIRVNSDMGKGDCILETSKGNVDVSINNQLDEVKDLVTSILNNE